jgi:Mrp family chromosome partitioning ATPase
LRERSEVNPEARPLLDPGAHGVYYRELAENLRALDGPPSSVVVTGVSGGVGCSSMCLGLGGALGALGLKAAVVDCNLGSPRLHRMLGEPNFTGLTASQESGSPLEDCGYEPAPGLLVVPTGPIPEDPASNLEPGRLAGTVQELRENRDLVLLDSPELPQVLETPALLEGFDGVLLVVHAGRTARSEAREAAGELAEAGANVLGVVLNGG